jgi:hypothetical protein
MQFLRISTHACAPALARNSLNQRFVQEQIYTEQIRRFRAPLELTFKIFIACEDQAAFRHAKKVQGVVEALCGNQIALSRVFWNFALFRHEQLRKFAVMEAAEAEMVVIALDGGDDLPFHVREWAESLPVRPHAGQTALVTLIGSNRATRTQPGPAVAYLRGIAESRGMDFFCNQDDWDVLALAQPAPRREENWSAEPETMIYDRIPCSSKDIDDLVDKLNLKLKSRYEYKLL